MTIKDFFQSYKFEINMTQLQNKIKATIFFFIKLYFNMDHLNEILIIILLFNP